MQKIKHYFRNENKVNENKVLSYCKALRCETIKNNKKLFSFMSNLQAYNHFKLDFKNVDQNTGGKWLIHGIKRRTDNHSQHLRSNICLRCKSEHNDMIERNNSSNNNNNKNK